MAAINFPNSPSAGDTYTVGARVYYYDGASWLLANTSISTSAAFDKANLANQLANGAFRQANVANTLSVGNTMSNGYFTVRTSQRTRLNFIPASANVRVNVDDDSAGDRINVTIEAISGGGGGAPGTGMNVTLGNTLANTYYLNRVGPYANINLIDDALLKWNINDDSTNFRANVYAIVDRAPFNVANTANLYANLAFMAANAAFAKANTANTTADLALPKAGGVVTGLLDVDSTDGRVRIGEGTFSGKSSSTDYGIQLGEASWPVSGLTTEVDGTILSLGTNIYQIGGRTTTEVGGIFRFDTRTNNREFVVIAQQPGDSGTSENTVFRISLVDPFGVTFKGNVTAPYYLTTAGMNLEPTIIASFAVANNANLYANLAFRAANAAFAVANLALPAAGGTITGDLRVNGLIQGNVVANVINILSQGVGSNTGYLRVNTGNVHYYATPSFDVWQLLSNSAVTYNVVSINVKTSGAGDQSSLLGIYNDGSKVFGVVRGSSGDYWTQVLGPLSGQGPRILVGADGDTAARISFGVSAAGVPLLHFGPGGGTTRDVGLERANAGNLIIQGGATSTARGNLFASNIYASNSVSAIDGNFSNNVNATLAATIGAAIVSGLNVQPAIVAAFLQANNSNLVTTGNTMANSYYATRATRDRLNFVPGTGITVNVDDDSSGDRVNVTIATSGAGGLTDIVQDLTPQLGGELDANGYNIDFTDAHGITWNDGDTTFKVTGSGDGKDLKIDYGAVDTWPSFTLLSSTPGSDSVGFIMMKDSASPAVDDFIGYFEAWGRDTSGGDVAKYGGFAVQIVSAADGAHTGSLQLKTGSAGSWQTSLDIRGQTFLYNTGAIFNWNAGDVTLTHSTNALTVAGGDFFVPDEAYDISGWDADLSVPTKNAVRDKIVLLEAIDTAVFGTANSHNGAMAQMNTAIFGVANNANLYANLAFRAANAVYDFANVININVAATMLMANFANLLANSLSNVAQTYSNGYVVLQSSRGTLNFMADTTDLKIRIQDNATHGLTNVRFDAPGIGLAFNLANAANILANQVSAVAQTYSNGYVIQMSTRGTLNFMADTTDIKILVHDNATHGLVNVRFDAPGIGAAYTQANAAKTEADAVFGVANVHNAAMAQMNSAIFGVANNANLYANLAFRAANAAYDFANAINIKVDTTGNALSNVANTYSNGYVVLQSSRGTLNFMADTTDIKIRIQDNATHGLTNVRFDAPGIGLAYAQSNIAMLTVSSAYDRVNVVSGVANTANDRANLAQMASNAAFAVANLALPAAGGTVTGDLQINGSLRSNLTGNIVNILSNGVGTNTGYLRVNTGNVHFYSTPSLEVYQIWSNTALTYNAFTVNVKSVNGFGGGSGTGHLFTLLNDGQAVVDISRAATGETIGKLQGPGGTGNGNRFQLSLDGESFARINFGIDVDSVPAFTLGPGTGARDLGLARANAGNLITSTNDRLSSGTRANLHALHVRVTGELEGTNVYTQDIVVSRSAIVSALNVVPAIVAAFLQANNSNLKITGNTMANGYYATRATRRMLNFVPGTGISINVDDDSAGDHVNISIASSVTGQDKNVTFGNVLANGYYLTRSSAFSNVALLDDDLMIVWNVDDDTAQFRVNAKGTLSRAPFAVANNANLYANLAFRAANAVYDFANVININVAATMLMANFANILANSLSNVAQTYSNGYVVLQSSRGTLNFMADTTDIKIRIQDNATHGLTNVRFDAPGIGAAYTLANSANILANQLSAVAQTYSNGYVIQMSTRGTINFMADTTDIKILVHDNATHGLVNVRFDAPGIGAAYTQANAAKTEADAVFGVANVHNAAMAQMNSAIFGVANNANLYANLAFMAANAVFGVANLHNAAMAQMNVAIFGQANTSNLMAVGNTIASNGYFTVRGNQTRLNFIPGANVTINVTPDVTGDRMNVIIESYSTGGAAASGPPVQVSEAEPGTTTANSLWFKSDTGALYVRYDDGTSTQWVEVGAFGIGIQREETITIALSDEGSQVTAGINKFTMHFAKPFSVTNAFATLSQNAATGGGNTHVNVKRNGTTIFTTNLTILAANGTTDTGPAGAGTATPPQPVLTTVPIPFARGDKMNVDVELAGTSAAGLKLHLIGYYT